MSRFVGLCCEGKLAHKNITLLLFLLICTGYAVTCTFDNVLLTFAGTFLMIL